MKKRILAMLLSALLVANISACNCVFDNIQKKENGSTIDTSDNIQNTESTIESGDKNNQTQPPVYTTQDLVEILQLSNTFSMVLKNETKVCNSIDSSLVYLNDYINGSMRYADVSAIDLDGNGVNDVIVLEWGDRVILLKEYEGIVYAWKYRHTALYYLRTDGTYAWSTQAGNIYGSSKLQFDGEIRNDVELDRVEYNEKFYINEIEVSQDTFQTYVQNEKLAEKADRYCWETGFKAPDDQIDGK